MEIQASLDFLKSSPANTALRFESVPPGAEVKVSGQTCRTPCELTLQVAELSATFTRRGYQPQTISVHSEGGVLGGFKWSSQRAVCWPIVEVRQVPLPAFSIRVSCVAVC